MGENLLAPLGDRALAYLGDLAFRQGRESLHAKAPRLMEWLRDECAREQGRRRGEPVEPAADPVLADLSGEELEATARAVTLFAVAVRNYGVAREGELAADDVAAVLELMGVFEALTAACRAALSAASRPSTMH